MSSRFIEDTEQQSNPTEEQFSSIDDADDTQAVQNPVEDQPVESADTSVDDDLPEKYRGKSAKEIAKMHQEAEKAMGRQGSEVGELRRLVDDFIRSQASTKTQSTQYQAPSDTDEEVDFFADPQKAIDRAIAKHPKVREAEQLSASMRKAEALATLKASHPDFQNVIGSTDFAEWVSKSKVRQELFIRADQGYDYSAADELLTTFKERQQAVQQAAQVAKAEQKASVKAASTGSTKGAGSESVSKKIYRRADIMDLMIKNPDRYLALSDEIMAAYAENRVR